MFWLFYLSFTVFSPLFFFIGPLTILKSPSSPDHDPGFQLHTSNGQVEFPPQHPKGTLRPPSTSPSHPALPSGGCVFHFTRLVLGGPFQSKYSFFFFFPQLRKHFLFLFLSLLFLSSLSVVSF